MTRRKLTAKQRRLLGDTSVRSKILSGATAVASKIATKILSDTIESAPDLISNHGKKGIASLLEWHENRRRKNSPSERYVSPPLSVPTSFGQVVSSMPYGFSSAPVHIVNGPGLRVKGSEIVGSVHTTTSASEDYWVFNCNGLPQSGITMNPLHIVNSSYQFKRLAQFALQFDHFRFRNFTIRYIPYSGTAETGNFAVGFCRDPVEVLALPEEVMICSPSAMSPYYIGFKLSIPCGGGPEVFYTRIPSGVNAPSTIRQCNQGQIPLRGKKVDEENPRQLGTILVEYVVDLYSPCTTR